MLALAFSSLGLGSAQATDKATGRPCISEFYFDGQGIQQLGYRCAQAIIHYNSYSSVLWNVYSYNITYTVSAGLSFGPHSDENPYKVATGFQSGTQQWISPDNGGSNTSVYRDVPNAHTYKGQTVVQIDAYPDIPNVNDPRLDADTASW